MVTISPESVNAVYDSTVTLTCEVQSLTTPTVTWTSNTDVDLTSTSLDSDDDNYIHTSILTLEQVTLEYIGEYTCTAVNERGEISDMINVDVYGKNMSLSTHLCLIYICICPVQLIVLIIHLPLCLSPVPPPVVAISPESVNVSYNSTVTLTCEVQSLTTPNVTWTSDTDVTLPSTSLDSINYTHTSILTLEQVTLEYIGEYNCTAVNEGGEISDMINVDVYGKNMSLSICMSVCIHLFVCLFHSSFL